MEPESKNSQKKPNPNLGPKKKMVLSLDGGGMRGIAVARILIEIEKRTNRRIHELFNVVVGTSTGGLLAVLLTIKPTKHEGILTAQQILETYRDKAAQIFDDKFIRKLYISGTIDSLRNARFDQAGLKKVIEELYDPKERYSLAKADPGVEVGLCCSDSRTRKPILLNSYRARQDPNDYRHSTHLLYLILATSAAPTYFEPITLSKYDVLPSVGEAVDKTSKTVKLTEKANFALQDAKEAKQHKEVHRGRALSVDWYDKVTTQKPTFYHRNQIHLEDGGVTKNNPSHLGFTLAKKLILQEGGDKSYDIENIKVLSIGTGSKYFEDGQEMDPSEYRELYPEVEDESEHWAWTKPFRLVGNWAKWGVGKALDGSGFGTTGVLSRWTTDPFDMDQSSWNAHLKVLDLYRDENMDKNYIRIQYNVHKKYIADMSAHEKSAIDSLIHSAEKYLYRDYDEKNPDPNKEYELSEEFEKVLKLIDPDYYENGAGRKTLLK